MNDLLYIENPALFIITAVLAVISVICAFLPKRTVISYTAALCHAFAVAAAVYFGGGLTDIALMLILSLIFSLIAESISDKFKRKGNKQ